MKPIHTFESFLFEGIKEKVIEIVIKDIAGNIYDDGEMTKKDAEKWFKGEEGKTAIESALEALEEEYDHTVTYSQIKDIVAKKVLAMDIFAEED